MNFIYKQILFCKVLFVQILTLNKLVEQTYNLCNEYRFSIHFTQNMVKKHTPYGTNL